MTKYKRRRAKRRRLRAERQRAQRVEEGLRGTRFCSDCHREFPLAETHQWSKRVYLCVTCLWKRHLAKQPRMQNLGVWTQGSGAGTWKINTIGAGVIGAPSYPYGTTCGGNGNVLYDDHTITINNGGSYSSINSI